MLSLMSEVRHCAAESVCVCQGQLPGGQLGLRYSLYICVVCVYVACVLRLLMCECVCVSPVWWRLSQSLTVLVCRTAFGVEKARCLGILSDTRPGPSISQ